MRTAARDGHTRGNASLVSPSLQLASEFPPFEVLESLANDIEHFDPENSDQNIDNYFRELENTLIDLHNAPQREKVKLVFIQTLPPSVRNDYIELHQALIEEFSSTADEIAAMVAASQIKQSRLEHPRDYYKCLRRVLSRKKRHQAYKKTTFKSLFLQNLQPCIRTHVVLRTHHSKPSMHELRKVTQMAWETIVTSKAKGGTPAPTSSDTKVSHTPTASKDHPHSRTKGGDKKSNRDTERNRHVHQLRRDRHSQNRSSRRPYAEILAQNVDHPIDRPDDDFIISDQSLTDSDITSDYSFTERYSPEPRVKNPKHKSSRVRFSQY
ncbi:hypothetical protein F2P81_021906 [Scophthalmus maximus]|uniref:Retrotransposon gag domain-containing protein n=1 Tax=Scophthalmus maximus TaxID=52904 RepID=A0A6A4RY88_SCOMX|nr:hypothetical protein F2P81_021906 [Scophthalmus maximus]